VVEVHGPPSTGPNKRCVESTCIYIIKYMHSHEITEMRNRWVKTNGSTLWTPKLPNFGVFCLA